MTQTNLSFLSWCKILSGALCIWTGQNQPEFEQVKNWIFSHQANMINMLLIIVSMENITHILWTCIQMLITLSIQPLCWVAHGCYTDYLTFQKINGLSLNTIRVSSLSKINTFKIFLLAVLSTLTMLLCFMKHLALKMRKNEADATQKQWPGRQKEMGTSWNGNLFISCHL